MTAFTSSDVDDLLRDMAETVTLRRPGAPNVDVSCIAVVGGAEPVESGGGAVQFRREITISNTEIAAASWPGPPARGDAVLTDGGAKKLTVQAVDTATVGAETVKHVMMTIGA